MSAISVVIPVRDRSGTRVENCLRSLRWQRTDPGRLEIVLSDLGSEPSHLAALKQLAAAHDARVIATPASGFFNRSRALNIGIRASRADIVLCTDIDMIFEDTFLEAVLDAARHRDNALVLSQCQNLPPLPERTYERGDFEALRAQSQQRLTKGTGACQAARRSFFEDVHGYDEQMRHWGFEDTDLLKRALRYGLVPVWVNDRTSMLHQWHPTRKSQHRFAVERNRVRHLLTRHVVVKNRRGWGQ